MTIATAALEQRVELADSRIKPWQKAIFAGHYFYYWRDREHVLAKVLRRRRGGNICYCFCISLSYPEGRYINVHISLAEGFIGEEVFTLIHAMIKTERKCL